MKPNLDRSWKKNVIVSYDATTDEYAIAEDPRPLLPGREPVEYARQASFAHVGTQAVLAIEHEMTDKVAERLHKNLQEAKARRDSLRHKIKNCIIVIGKLRQLDADDDGHYQRSWYCRLQRLEQRVDAIIRNSSVTSRGEPRRTAHDIRRSWDRTGDGVNREKLAHRYIRAVEHVLAYYQGQLAEQDADIEAVTKSA